MLYDNVSQAFIFGKYSDLQRLLSHDPNRAFFPNLSDFVQIWSNVDCGKWLATQGNVYCAEMEWMKYFLALPLKFGHGYVISSHAV